MNPNNQKEGLVPRAGEIACDSCGLTMAESHALYDLKRGAVVLAQALGDAINPVSVQVQHQGAGGAGAAQTCRSKGDARPAAPAPDQIAWAHELQMRVMLVDADGDDDLHNFLGEVACCLAALTGRPSAPAVATPADQLAFELPTGEPVIRNVGAAVDATGAVGPANSLSAADVDQNILSVALWLYRRLPRCYGRPPHVEGPIKALARRVGTDVAECLAERGPDPAAGDAK